MGGKSPGLSDATDRRVLQGQSGYDTNVGLIKIVWQPQRPVVMLQIVDMNGQIRIAQRLNYRAIGAIVLPRL